MENTVLTRSRRVRDAGGPASGVGGRVLRWSGSSSSSEGRPVAVTGAVVVTEMSRRRGRRRFARLVLVALVPVARSEFARLRGTRRIVSVGCYGCCDAAVSFESSSSSPRRMPPRARVYPSAARCPLVRARRVTSVSDRRRPCRRRSTARRPRGPQERRDRSCRRAHRPGRRDRPIRVPAGTATARPRGADDAVPR